MRRDFAGLERRRMAAARLFKEGHSQAEVARLLKVSRVTALRWARAWQRDGRRALRSAGRAGRRPRLSPEQLRQVEAQLLKGPQALGYRTELWTLPRIARLVCQLTGVRYHPGHVWRLLRALGWSRQKPSTRARERDEEAISRWRKVTWSEIKKTPGAGAPGSSLSTKAVSPSGPRSDALGHRVAKLPS